MARKRARPPEGFTTDEHGELRRRPSKGPGRRPVRKGFNESAVGAVIGAAKKAATDEVCRVEDRRVFDILDAAGLSPADADLRELVRVRLKAELAGIEERLMSAVTRAMLDRAASKEDRRSSGKARRKKGGKARRKKARRR